MIQILLTCKSDKAKDKDNLEFDELEKLSYDLNCANCIIEIIDNNTLVNDINKYISPFFYINKNGDKTKDKKVISKSDNKLIKKLNN